MQHSSLRRVIVAALALAAGAAAPAYGQTIFAMDYSPGSFPAAGWTRVKASSADHQIVFLAGGGPNGQNAMEMRQLPNPVLQQYEWGWDGNLEPSDPPQGDRRYYRWRLYFTPDSNYLALDPFNRERVNASNKMLIIGQGCSGGRCRVILTVKGEPGSRKIAFGIAIDGGVDQTETEYVYNSGQWLNVQLELDSSSTTSTGDGGWKLWVNNGNYDAPTLIRAGIRLHSSNWRYVGFGSYNNNALEPGGVNVWRNADFQVGASFDSSWASGGSGGGGPTPTPTPPTAAPQAPRNVRIVGGP